MAKQRQQHIDGKKMHGNKKHKFGKRKHTAVVFDQQQRNSYLKGIFGAKNRRREFYQKQQAEKLKQVKKQQKTDHKAHRREELRKAKQLLAQLKGNAKKQEDQYEEKEVQVKKEGNVVIQTKFY